MEKDTKRFFLTSQGLLILGIFFFMMMSISGIYASYVQIVNDSIVMGNVNINVETYTLNGNEEVVFDESTHNNYYPGQTIPFVPKIKNLGESCYVRAKITYINDDVDETQYISGVPAEWKRVGDYYYYDGELITLNVVELFHTITIPENVLDLTSSNKIPISITAEAVQYEHFTPDYTLEDPWQDAGPIESSSTYYNIDSGTDSKVTIEYENKAEEDITVPNTFFGNLMDVMPGDSYTANKVTLDNKNKKDAKYYVSVRIQDSGEYYNKEVELLESLTLTITTKDGKVVYSDKIKNGVPMYLGGYDIGSSDEFTFKIDVPTEINNRYENLSPNIIWTYSVEYTQEKKEDKKEDKKSISPKTGDKINAAITVFLISTVCLVIVMILYYREKRESE